jgi:hypothetical protein
MLKSYLYNRKCLASQDFSGEENGIFSDKAGDRGIPFGANHLPSAPAFFTSAGYDHHITYFVLGLQPRIYNTT